MNSKLREDLFKAEKAIEFGQTSDNTLFGIAQIIQVINRILYMSLMHYKLSQKTKNFKRLMQAINLFPFSSDNTKGGIVDALKLTAMLLLAHVWYQEEVK